ncbi:hypothetical protein JRQ81_009795, partial [Phrynocephalus forsythii]
FTNYMRSPAGDIFNPEHYNVNQDMTQPLSHYFITSSHNTYLMGDQLMSQSRVDMYAWVLQSGCRCVEVDCWDGPDGEPIVHHGYTLTSKILFKDVIETINKYAFIKSEYPVILSIENHCSVAQQKKMAQYLREILGDKLDLSSVSNEDPTRLPSPESLKGKILVKGKKLPANISEDVEEGEVSDEDSADEIEDDCKLMNGDASSNRKRVENIAKKKLDTLIKESKIRDCEDPNNFTVNTLSSGKLSHKQDLKKVNFKKSFPSYFSIFFESGAPGKRAQQTNRQKKTMKLSRALSDLVKYTKSVGMHDVESETFSSWQVSSFSETKAHQILQQKPVQYLRFNQHQLSRIYPSSYRVDSSNYNPQPFWNAGCQLVALNYQSEGRMLQLNRAKFSANGNCGYVLKPKCMSQGIFNPNSEDPLLGQMKKQLVLRIISGQQLPKPRDSMLGDRGEIIDPFVEVEIIGLPVDCCKEQTRVVDDNGFNPMWEETLVFTICMPEIALVRFLVWDHDPIGRDFIGQRTIAFESMMPGYRHVYLEGMEEASVFVHVAISDISGKAKQALGLKGLFLRSPKQASLDSHAAGQLNRKHSFSSHLLRRTASAPTKTQKKARKGFPEIAIDTKDNGSEGAIEGQDLDDSSLPRFDQEPGCASSPAPSLRGCTQAEAKGFKDVCQFSMQRSISSLGSLETIREEPLVAKDSQPHVHPPTSPAPDSKDGHVPDDPSHDAGGEDSNRSHPPLEKPPPLHQCAGSLLEGKVNSAALGQEDRWKSEEGMGWKETCGSGDQSGSQTQDHVAFATSHGFHPASRCWEQRHSRAGGRVKAERAEKGNAVTGQVRQSNQINSAMPASPQDSPQEAPAPMITTSHLVVRRSKSDGYKLCDCSVSPRPPGGFSPAAEVYSDATFNDHIWSKLDPSKLRDSMSSSSSMSSNDTVIDLSLPSLARKSLPDLGAQPVDFETPAEKRSMRPWSASTALRCNPPMVAKSKSNPNLRENQGREDELHPRPLAKVLEVGVSLMNQRPTWSQLYMESLKRSCLKPQGQEKAEMNQAKSKSLGDLTSDDITCTFESRYRRISRSFITRSMREQRCCAMARSSANPPDGLTEQLRKLTAFQQEGDITSPTSLVPTELEEEEEEEEEGVGLQRRYSSRSQSRVKYIANRARQAQERQRLKTLALTTSSPIEERGNPEGACSFTRGACTDTAAPHLFTSQYKNRTDSNPDTEVVFMFKL